MRQASNESRSLSSIAPCDSDQNKCHSLKISPHLKVVVLWNLAINPIVTSIKIMKKIKINSGSGISKTIYHNGSYSLFTKRILQSFKI